MNWVVNKHADVAGVCKLTITSWQPHTESGYHATHTSAKAVSRRKNSPRPGRSTTNTPPGLSLPPRPTMYVTGGEKSAGGQGGVVYAA